MGATKVQRTYQARIVAPEGTVGAMLDAYADLYGQAERTLFADIARGRDPAAVKSSYLVCFGLTARQFTAIAITLKGTVASIKKRREGLIAEAEARLKKAEQVIKALDGQRARAASPARRQRLTQTRHHKHRRLARLRDRLARLTVDRTADVVRICFGSRTLFRAQFNLAANGYESLDQWREDWRRARARQFYVLGSKDETGGCQGCVADYLGEQRFALRLRLPNRLCRGGDTYVRCNIRLPDGTKALVAALTLGQAISYRFQRDAKGWRVFITTQARPFERRSDRRLGAIGVDLNADHLAVCETDRCGNPIAAFTLPLVTDGLDRHQTQARIGEAIKTLMDFARDRGKPLAIETLDFSSKTAALEAEGGRYARMRSALAYARIIATLKARAYDAGLAVLSCNPAYTSVIGRETFAERYGLGPHHAAALVIARRALTLSERPNRHAGTARPRPVRTRGRHVWALGRQVAREQRRRHRTGGRSPDRSRSPPTPRGTARTVTRSPVAGESPARQSSAALFGRRP